MQAIDEFVRLQEYAKSERAVLCCDCEQNAWSTFSDFIDSDIGRIAQDLAARLQRIRAIAELMGYDECCETLEKILDLTDTAKPLGEK